MTSSHEWVRGTARQRLRTMRQVLVILLLLLKALSDCCYLRSLSVLRCRSFGTFRRSFVFGSSRPKKKIKQRKQGHADHQGVAARPALGGDGRSRARARGPGYAGRAAPASTSPGSRGPGTSRTRGVCGSPGPRSAGGRVRAPASDPRMCPRLVVSSKVKLAQSTTSLCRSAAHVVRRIACAHLHRRLRLATMCHFSAGSLAHPRLMRTILAAFVCTSKVCAVLDLCREAGHQQQLFGCCGQISCKLKCVCVLT